MNLAFALAFFLPLIPLAVDLHAAPPNPYDRLGGRRTQEFSEANAVAVHFLSILDNQAFGGAWLESGGMMKDIVPQEVWAAGMQAVRRPLGTVKARKVNSHQKAIELPSGTEGEFMIIKYATQFAQKPNALETVVLMMQPPLGLWKVICYSVGQ